MRSLMLLVLLLAGGGDVGAQLVPSHPISAQECARQAAAIGPRDPTARLWGRLADCGAMGGTALANALGGAHWPVDTTYLRSLVAVGSRIQDPTLLSTALRVAEDRSAGDLPRIAAMLIALAQIDNHRVLPIGVTWPHGSSCRFGYDPHARYGSTTPLPSNAAAQMGSRLDGIIFATPPNSQAVTEAATCVREALMVEAPESVDPAQITLAYVCGNTFRVVNASRRWIDVSYAVSSSNEKGDLEVGPSSSEEFEVDIKGSVLLVYLGRTIRQVANGGTPCPP
ncbi:MAG TPA: hypothetical protein VFZ21_07385 [Gemmatimonadaceae bacterium]|nr:hypothetical protein [Gemmatimonadaceae bacterium]